MKLIIEVEMYCPYCGARHVDEDRNGERWDRRAHTTHRCQSCGRDWDVYVSGKAPEAIAELKTLVVGKVEGLGLHVPVTSASGSLPTSKPQRQMECLSCEGLGSIEVTGLRCKTCGGSGWVTV